MARDHSRDLWCVGLHYESQDDKKAGKVSGYRVLGSAVEGYKDVDVATMKAQLQKYPDRVRGLQLSPNTGEVIGACGDLHNYPKYIKGGSANDGPETMILIGKIPGSGVRVYFLNGVFWVDYDTLRKLIANGTMFANAPMPKGTTDQDFDNLATYDGIPVGIHDPKGTNKDGRPIDPDLYEEAALHFGLAVDASAIRRDIAKQNKGKDDTEIDKLLQQTLQQIQSNGVKVVNRHMDTTGGIYLRGADGFTVEDRLLRASRVLRSYAPFMYSAYSALKKVDTYDIPTAAVSLNEFMFNPHFINAVVTHIYSIYWSMKFHTF